jgi:hypothetical protein
MPLRSFLIADLIESALTEKTLAVHLWNDHGMETQWKRKRARPECAPLHAFGFHCLRPHSTRL